MNPDQINIQKMKIYNPNLSINNNNYQVYSNADNRQLDNESSPQPMLNKSINSDQIEKDDSSSDNSF